MSDVVVSVAEIRTILAAGPYRGLAPYEDSDVDARFFFGREHETEVIVANLMAARLTVLYGASGVGKSSLLKAGVAQSLRAVGDESRERGGRPELAVAVFSDWRDDPVRVLREAVAAELASEVGSAPEPTDGSLAETFGRWTDELGVELYLVLDQVEEYFLYHGRERGPGTFAEELPELVNRPGLRVNVLLGIREDALAKLDFFKARIPRLLSNYLRLDHLDREAGRAAILKPLEQFERLGGEAHRAEPKLVEAVLDQVAAGRIADDHAGVGGVEEASDLARIEAPYLQLVLQRLWEVESASGSRILRLATFEQLGGAQQIVEDHVDRALAGLDSSEKAAAAEIFKYLVTPSGTKIAHAADDLAEYAGVGDSELAPVLASLVRERIVRPLPAGDQPGRGRYEIYHDVLAERVLAWRARFESERVLEAERRDAERRHRRLLVLALATLVALAAMAAVAIFALAQRSDARSSARAARSAARAAHARELSASATSVLPSDPLRSVDLAAQAARLDPTRAAEDVLRSALLALHVRQVLRAGQGLVLAAAYSPDGTRVVTADADGTARIFRVGGGRIVVLRHRGPVTDAKFSPDGRLVATSSRDRTVRLVSAGGHAVRTITQPSPVLALAFSPDSRRLVTSGADGALRIVSVPEGKPLVVAHGAGAASRLVVSPDGHVVVAVGADRFARAYDVISGRPLYQLPHRGAVTSAAFSPRGGVLATGSRDGTAHTWDARQGTVQHEFRPRGRPHQILDVAFSPRGSLLATAGADGTGRVWEVARENLFAVLMGHGNLVRSVSFSRDGLFIVTSSTDGTARIWKTRTGFPQAVLAGHALSVRGAVFNPLGNSVLTWGDDGTARIWDPGVRPDLRLIGRHAGPITALDIRRDSSLVVTASDDGSARIWRVGGGLVAALRHRGAVTAASFSPDGKLVVTASRDHTARVWSASGAPLGLLPQSAAVTSAAFSPDSKLIATGSADGSASIWRREGGRLFRLTQPAPVRALAFSPDGSLLAVAGGDRTVRVWRVAEGKLEWTGRGHRGQITALSFSRDGRHIVTASKDLTARIWSAESGALEHVLKGHAGVVTSAVFSPDGRLVVTASGDHDARIWDVRTSRRTLRSLRVLRAHAAVVSDARFSPDGRWIVTAGPSTAGLWDVATGRLVTRLREHKGPITAARFTPDGKRIVTTGMDGTVRVYRCDICGTIPELEALAQARLAQIPRAS